jgi:predicted ArsR family transcriptional regulator
MNASPSDTSNDRNGSEPLPLPADLTTESALPAKRHRHLDLLHLIRIKSQMTVQELSAQLQVSSDTIRRDLDHLAAQGRLTRTYGGAVANENAFAG